MKRSTKKSNLKNNQGTQKEHRGETDCPGLNCLWISCRDVDAAWRLESARRLSSHWASGDHGHDAYEGILQPLSGKNAQH